MGVVRAPGGRGGNREAVSVQDRGDRAVGNPAPPIGTPRPRMAECLHWAPNCTSPRCDGGSFLVLVLGLPSAFEPSRRRCRRSSWYPRRPGSASGPCSRSGWRRDGATKTVSRTGRRRAWRGCRSMPRIASCAVRHSPCRGHPDEQPQGGCGGAGAASERPRPSAGGRCKTVRPSRN